MGAIGEAITTGLSNIIQPILDGIKAIFLPDIDNIREKVDIVKGKFAFVDNIKEVSSDLIDFMQNEDAKIPVIYINLGASKGKINYGGNTKILDLTWYAPYKPVVDAFIIGFSYLMFFWMVWKRLPDIISGVGAVTEKSIHISKGGKK